MPPILLRRSAEGFFPPFWRPFFTVIIMAALCIMFRSQMAAAARATALWRGFPVVVGAEGSRIGRKSMSTAAVIAAVPEVSLRSRNVFEGCNSRSQVVNQKRELSGHPAKSRDAKDFVPLEGTDFLEIYCGNAKQSAHWYSSVFGFQPLAYAGLETGLKDRTSYVLQQGNIKLVLTCALVPDNEIAEHVKLHGDGVRFASLLTTDARAAFEDATKRGAKPYLSPKELTDENGTVIMSGIHAYGDTIHLFIERKDYRGVFLPGFRKWSSSYHHSEVGLKDMDHLVGNVEMGQMNRWCKFYQDVFGMTNLISFDDKDISTKYTALMSKVMSTRSGSVKYPINEPAEGLKRSQIEEYLDFYKSAGVQHIAVSTDDIVKTIDELMSRGCEFLYVPGTYYDTVTERCGAIDEDLQTLKKYGILVDRDPSGYLLQIFTRPVGDRPTLFFEIIQRKGAKSFGKGNFRALFESIEEEQRLRRTLDK